MAYMNQEHKARIREQLKRAIPKSWKWSLGVRHHSTIVLNIYSAPVNLIHAYTENACSDEVRNACRSQMHMQLNPYHWHDHFSGELGKTFEKIMSALNIDNHDRSDIMTDYFDVGHYVDVNLGRWDRPFIVQ